MNFDVRITRAAHRDILEMISYISKVLKNRKAVSEHMKGVYSILLAIR